MNKATHECRSILNLKKEKSKCAGKGGWVKGGRKKQCQNVSWMVGKWNSKDKGETSH